MGPNEEFCQNFGAYVKIYQMVQRGETSWTNLTPEQQSEMDQALVVLIRAAGNARLSWFIHQTHCFLLSFLTEFSDLYFALSCAEKGRTEAQAAVGDIFNGDNTHLCLLLDAFELSSQFNPDS